MSLLTMTTRKMEKLNGSSIFLQGLILIVIGAGSTLISGIILYRQEKNI